MNKNKFFKIINLLGLLNCVAMAHYINEAVPLFFCCFFVVWLIADEAFKYRPQRLLSKTLIENFLFTFWIMLVPIEYFSYTYFIFVLAFSFQFIISISYKLNYVYINIFNLLIALLIINFRCSKMQFIQYTSILIVAILIFYALYEYMEKMKQNFKIKDNLHKKEIEIKELEKSIEVHNIANTISSIILHTELTIRNKTEKEKHLQLIKSILETVKVTKITTKEAIKAAIKRNHLKYPNIRLITKIDSKIPDYEPKLILDTLIVLLDNASESGADTVTLYANKHCIKVIDNGNGFDVNKIKNGYSTKNGNGVGLYYSIEMCRKKDIPLIIDSKLGHGTKATINIGGSGISVH